MERKILYASEGMLLTNGKDIGKVVFLGENDIADNWQEVSQEQIERLMNIG